jgi:hypothetical protein
MNAGTYDRELYGKRLVWIPQPCDDHCCLFWPYRGAAEFERNMLQAPLARVLNLSDGTINHIEPWWEAWKLSYLQPDEERHCGRFTIRNITVTDWEGWLSEAQLIGRMIPPGKYTCIYEHHEEGPATLWMSDTPAEVLGHYEFLKAAHGRILVLGLGLGIVVQHLLPKRCVTSIDVIELNSDVIKLVSPFITDPRVRIYQGDGLQVRPSQTGGGEWDVMFADIWPRISGENHPDMIRIRKKYGRLTKRIFQWEERMVKEMADLWPRRW